MDATKNASPSIPNRISNKNLSGMVKHIKCVLVGDSCTDKTKVVVKYTLGEQNTCRTDRGTVDAFDNYNANLKVDGVMVEIDLWDVADNEKFVAIRGLCYSGASIVILFFRCTDPKSADNLVKKWAREVVQHCPATPWIVVGTHASDRSKAESLGKPVISKAAGQALADEIGAVSYIETQSDVQSYTDLFDRSVRVALGSQFVGMRKRLRFVEGICDEHLRTLDEEAKAVNLAIWRGDDGDTEALAPSIKARSEEVKTWEELKKDLQVVAREDPAHQQEETGCSIQ